MKMKFFLLFFLILCLKIVQAQVLESFPPNPEASSLLKSIDVPLDAHSGLANINIPIYTINTKSLKIPISLSYHSRGIKVGEIASSVGLGWSLNVGGLVSRQVRGTRPDDRLGGYLNTGTVGAFYTEFFEEHGQRVRNILRQQFSSGMLQQDVAPDIFYFKLPISNGKFIIDQYDYLPVQQKFSNTNIEIIWESGVGSKINGFKMTDQDGNEFHFGYANNTSTTQTINYKQIFPQTILDLPTDETPYIDTWYLSKIKTSLNEVVKFIYRDEVIQYWQRDYDSMSDHVSWSFFSGGASEPPIYNGVVTKSSMVTQKRSYQKQLSSIIYEQDTILFIADKIGREDLIGSKNLKKIRVKSMSNLIKEVDFNYNYRSMIPSDVNNMNHFFGAGVGSEGRKRMFLNSIKIVNTKNLMNENEELTYSFSYDEQPLPSRYTTSQDRWGYYNGKNNGEFLIKDGVNYYNRDVDTIKNQAGLLKAILLPTGGEQIFYYGQNKGSVTFPMKNIQMEGGNQNVDTYRVSKSIGIFDSIYSKRFLISERIQGAWLHATVSPSDGCGMYNYTNECPFILSHRVTNGGSTSGGYVGLGSRFINLSPGMHTISARPNGNYNQPDSSFNNTFFLLEISYDSIVSNDSDGFDGFRFIYGPGKRMDRIILKDSNQVKLDTKYKYGNDSKNESGAIFGIPDFNAYNSRGSGMSRYYSHANKPGVNFSSIQNNEIGYEIVQIHKIKGNEKIKEELKFTNFPDTGLFYEYPFHEPTDNQWLRGQLLERKIFKTAKDDLNYKLIQKINNKYNYSGDSNNTYLTPPQYYFGTFEFERPLPEIVRYVKNDSLFRFPLLIASTLVNGTSAVQHSDSDFSNGEDVHIQVHHFTGGTMDLVESKTIDYHEDGLEIETISKSEFDYSRNYNPVAIKQITSLGDSLGEKFYYPKDLLNDGIEIGKMQQLIDENRIGSPVKTESLHNNVITASSITKFDEFTVGDSNLLLPSESFSAKGSEDIENFNEEHRSISYDRYDDKGNVLQYTIENATPVSIIWGYNGKYPVAKIEGLSYNDIPQDLRNNIINASNADTTTCVGYSGCNEATLRNHQKSLRAYLVDAMITTYTYDPLVGVTSITPPNGQAAYYEYDGFGRLKSVKDEAGNIVQDIQYHYRSQE